MVIIYGLRHALSSTSDYFSHFSHFSVQEPSQLLQSLLVNPIGDPVVSSMWLGIIYIVTSVISYRFTLLDSRECPPNVAIGTYVSSILMCVQACIRQR